MVGIIFGVKLQNRGSKDQEFNCFQIMSERQEKVQAFDKRTVYEYFNLERKQYCLTSKKLVTK